MKPSGECPMCRKVKRLNVYLMGLCDDCAPVYERDMKERELQEALELARRHEAVLEQERMSFVW